MSDEARRDRMARNEALFRDLNDRVSAVVTDLDPNSVAETGAPHEYLCECSNSDCIAQVSLTAEEFQRVRSSPIQFAVLPGHETNEIETVVERADRYLIVQKDAGERAIAVATDPRA